MNKNPREIVLDILLDIEKNHKFSNAALNTALRVNQFMSKQDRAFITRLAEGVTEQRIRLDHIINQVSTTKIHKCKPLIRQVLRMGCYEIFYMDAVPDEATCNECVKLAAKRGFGSLKGFVNGVLRNICRNKETIKFPSASEDIVKYLSVRYSITEELVNLLLQDYGSIQTEKILTALFKARKTCIRVNTDRISVEAYMLLLQKNGIEVQKGKYNPTSLLISGYDYIRRVPGYFDGYFTVQDESSSLAVLAAGIHSGELILDICAAPGGKTLYAASLTGVNGQVISRDLSENKVELIEENIERLGVTNVRTQVYDATIRDETLIGKVDCVIADLPCSGLGIMGRKNDIKYNVTKEQVSELAALQRKILQVAAQYVKPGGRLIFSTCTILHEENEQNIKWLEQHTDLQLDSLEDYLPENLKERGSKGYLTLLPGEDSCDGFFISRFVKKQDEKNIG